MHEVEVIKANRKISDRAAGKTLDILRIAPYAKRKRKNNCKANYQQLTNNDAPLVCEHIKADK